MRKIISAFVPIAFLILLFSSCKKQETSIPGARLIFKFKFDSTQQRLNNLGQPAAVAAGHGGQSPLFNKMSAHYIELAPSAFTALGAGTVLYKAAETTTGGSRAIDFDQSTTAGNNETFFSVALKNITAGEYEWLRVSLAYQNYDIRYYVDTVINGMTIKQEFPGTVASFIGYNTYIRSYTIKNQSLVVNANKKQGYWGFEIVMNIPGAVILIRPVDSRPTAPPRW